MGAAAAVKAAKAGEGPRTPVRRTAAAAAVKAAKAAEGSAAAARAAAGSAAAGCRRGREPRLPMAAAGYARGMLDAMKIRQREDGTPRASYTCSCLRLHSARTLE